MNNFHYPKQPVVGIGVTVWREDKLLLVQRKNPPGQGHWGLPGGKQQLGETIFACAIREVREETALEIKPTGILTALDAITPDAAGKIEYHYTLIEVAAEWQSGEARAADDALAVRWVSPDEVEELCRWHEVTRIARLSLQRRKA